MHNRQLGTASPLSLPFSVRKIAKSGNTRYLSVGSILPPEWEVVKVTVLKIEGGVCVLRLEQIK